MPVTVKEGMQIQMSNVTIITNNVPRDVLDSWQLTKAEREDFDYLDWAALDEGRDSRSFVRYKGRLIDLNDMDGLARSVGLDGWDNYQSDSFFSGIVIRYADEQCETVICGRYYS